LFEKIGDKHYSKRKSRELQIEKFKSTQIYTGRKDELGRDVCVDNI